MQQVQHKKLLSVLQLSGETEQEEGEILWKQLGLFENKIGQNNLYF